MSHRAELHSLPCQCVSNGKLQSALEHVISKIILSLDFHGPYAAPFYIFALPQVDGSYNTGDKSVFNDLLTSINPGSTPVNARAIDH